MKSIKLTIVFLILLSFFYTNRAVNSQSNTNGLLELTEIVQKEKITLNSWKIYIMKPVKDVTSEKDIQREIERIQKDEEGYKWDISRDEGSEEQHYITVGYKQIEPKEIEMRVKVTAFLVGNKYRIYHSYEIKGQTWNKELWDFINANFNNEVNGQNEVFYTLKGTMKEKNGFELREEGDLLLREFSGTFVEGLIEDDLVSLSAYTNLLESYTLRINEKKINLQIGLRKNQKDDLIDVTIGTPIITSGY
ncbi:YwmB family TATA-box binding protein [Metabacillus endolithicus]|uniref:YwmB family TATA-box binding protein n=1 Tax=Metabacillus endolithicus TaxID=1535204 RepID=A0ABW5C3U5_9BACI|nr:YwmB family TATA-box binding protein [Metabacillus endolithicus]UPG66155.1 YwmB family TATA-box binding protein [Metabacillus endolithicus]